MPERINSVESSGDKLETRIRAVVDLYDSRKSAASAAGVSTDMLSRYMRGDSQPGFSVIANLCQPVGVSLSWVATGEGRMQAVSLDETEQRREDIYRAKAGDQAAADRVEGNFQEAAALIRD